MGCCIRITSNFISQWSRIFKTSWILVYQKKKKALIHTNFLYTINERKRKSMDEWRKYLNISKLPCIVNRILVNFKIDTCRWPALCNCSLEESFTLRRQIMKQDTHGSGTFSKYGHLEVVVRKNIFVLFAKLQTSYSRI